MKPPIGIVIGHSYVSPYGARVPGLDPEYFWNRDLCTHIQMGALDLGWKSYAVVDEPGNSKEFGVIGPQHDDLARLDCVAAIEIHHNAAARPDTNYSVYFHRAGCEISQDLAQRLSAALGPALKQTAGTSKSLVIGLPKAPWTNLQSVLESPVPLVLIETGFLSSPKYVNWCRQPGSMEWLGCTIAKVLYDFQEARSNA